jgi:hypothetical protein
METIFLRCSDGRILYLINLRRQLTQYQIIDGEQSSKKMETRWCQEEIVPIMQVS